MEGKKFKLNQGKTLSLIKGVKMRAIYVRTWFKVVPVLSLSFIVENDSQIRIADSARSTAVLQIFVAM